GGGLRAGAGRRARRPAPRSRAPRYGSRGPCLLALPGPSCAPGNEPLGGGGPRFPQAATPADHLDARPPHPRPAGLRRGLRRGEGRGGPRGGGVPRLPAAGRARGTRRSPGALPARPRRGQRPRPALTPLARPEAPAALTPPAPSPTAPAVRQHAGLGLPEARGTVLGSGTWRFATHRSGNTASSATSTP